MDKTEFATKLKTNQTLAERKAAELLGDNWYPQIIISGWIVDFYNPSKGLIVEIDGGYHRNRDQKRKDRYRDFYILKKYGIKTIRVTNNVVLKNPSLFLEKTNLDVNGRGIRRTESFNPKTGGNRKRKFYHTWGGPVTISKASNYVPQPVRLKK